MIGQRGDEKSKRTAACRSKSTGKTIKGELTVEVSKKKQASEQHPRRKETPRRADSSKEGVRWDDSYVSPHGQREEADMETVFEVVIREHTRARRMNEVKKSTAKAVAGRCTHQQGGEDPSSRKSQPHMRKRMGVSVEWLLDRRIHKWRIEEDAPRY